MTKYCPNCGTENLEVSRFCKKCGRPLDGNVPNNNVKKSNNNTIIIIVAIVAIIAIVAGAFLVLNNGTDYSTVHIVNATYFTDHTLDAKSLCTVNLGSENANKTVTVKVTYSRDGSNLGSDVTNETIGSDGTINLESSSSYKKYPDHAVLEVYDPEGNLLDSQDATLATDNSKQLATGNGTVTAKVIAAADHSASSSSSSSSSSSDPGAFYSEQDGRVIHTGEVVFAPDEHHWKHLGNDQWVKID